MKLLRPSGKPQNEALRKRGSAKKDAQPKIVAASWTQGQVHAVTAAKVVVWAMVVCGPIGLGLGSMALSNTSGAAVASTPSPTEPAGKQQAMELAQNVAVQWLTAHRGGEAQVAGLLPKAELPQTPLQVSDPTTAEVRWQGNAWVVIVAVTVTTTKEGETASQRRYFQVPVSIDDAGAGTVLMLPAEVAGPVVAAPGNQPYRIQVPPAAPVVLAAGEFLSAMLAGAGDVTRYTAPDSTIRAVDPAPYTAVMVESVYTTATLSDVPVEGDRVEVLVRARTETLEEPSIRLDYALSMTLRSSRWEVTAIRGAPTAEPLTSPGPATPAPRSTNN